MNSEQIVTVIHYLSTLILLYFVFLWLAYTFLLSSSFFKVLQKFKEVKYNDIYPSLNQKASIPISIIIPAYNQTARIRNTLDSIFKSEYQNYRIIVINDGSTDETLQLLKDDYALYPVPPAFKQIIKTGKVIQYYRSATVENMLVIDKEHSPFTNSAADSVNAGINVCQTPVFITLDADTLLEPNTLTRLLFTYLTHPHCICVGGGVYLSEGCTIKNGEIVKVRIPKNLTAASQVPEYLKSFLYGREGWTLLGGALSFAGALTFFETEAVIDSGGADSSNYAYDAESVMKLHHRMRKMGYPYQIIFDPDAQCWTEQPNSIKSLWLQRNKWQRGLLRSVCKNKRMVFNPRYGITGLIAFPLFIALEVFANVIEAIGYTIFIISIFFVPDPFAGLGWLVFLAWGFSTLITMAAMFLNLSTQKKYQSKMDVIYLFVLSTMDLLGFRQIRAFSTLFATIQYLFNRLRGQPQ